MEKVTHGYYGYLGEESRGNADPGAKGLVCLWNSWERSVVEAEREGWKRLVLDAVREVM